MFFKKKKEQNEDDRRQYQRFDFIQATFYKITTEDRENKVIECYLNNISIGGVSFDTQDELLNEGDEIKLMYKIGTILRRDSLKVRHIQRVFNNWRVGCAFLESDHERSQNIVKYIRSFISE